MNERIMFHSIAKVAAVAGLVISAAALSANAETIKTSYRIALEEAEFFQPEGAI